ncbi:unnamed protein product [[Candida] boidinii]|uniref:DNA topoisomerase (ATP-hydrolyzing) n=1 Tax=Candida boidinii TaxID=5477 RepID=A0A9W6ST27_CANBO|nr:unnamed protein product [[Candida] boidinii]GMF99305.1 unnamed protein product [[Candida] boidinii]
MAIILGEKIEVRLVYYNKGAKRGHSMNKIFKPMTTTILKFPSIQESVNLKFARYVSLMRLIYNNMILNIKQTKRQLYYQDVALFKNQPILDSVYQNLHESLGVSDPLDSLGIMPSQKGLFYITDPSVRIAIEENDCTRYIETVKPMLIPSFNYYRSPQNRSMVRLIGKVDEILIIEKEAIFIKMYHQFQSDVNKSRILITGKGFPDILTKQFLHHLCSGLNDNMIYIKGIFDSDIYGIRIFYDYKIKPLQLGEFEVPSPMGSHSPIDFDQKCPVINFQDKQNLSIIKQRSACPNMIFQGTFLLQQDNNLEFLDITLNDFNNMRLFLLNHLSNLENHETEYQKVKLEIQRGMFFFKKREIE